MVWWEWGQCKRRFGMIMWKNQRNRVFRVIYLWVWRMSLTVWGKKLLCSLVIKQLIHLDHCWMGWVLLFNNHWALLRHLTNSSWQAFLSWAMNIPSQFVIFQVRMHSTAPLFKVLGRGILFSHISFRSTALLSFLVEMRDELIRFALMLIPRTHKLFAFDRASFFLKSRISSLVLMTWAPLSNLPAIWILRIVCYLADEADVNVTLY